MSAFIVFDVHIRDPEQYREFMAGVKPVIEAAGGRYVARGGTYKVYEGDWQPHRIAMLEFPSIAAWEALYFGHRYRRLKIIRDRCSSARVIGFEGI